MISRIGFAPALPHLSLHDVQAHWAGRHAAASLRLPGVERYWQSHAVLRDGLPLLPWTGFDCCSEFDFADVVAMDRAFVSDAYYTQVKPDEEQLIDKSKGGMLIAERVPLGGAISTAAFRWMRFHRLAPLRRLALFGEALKAAPRVGGAVGRELYIALDGGAAGQRVAMYDAVEIDWFDDADTACAAALSADARARRHAFAELVRGTDHLIARVNRVRQRQQD